MKAALAVTALSITACGGGGDDEPNEANLEVSPTELTLLSGANSSATFAIRCNSNWNVTKTDSWLSVSATSGSSDGSITVTTLEKNESTSERTATILINSGEKSATVNVSQLPAYDAATGVEFTDLVVLAHSVAFKFSLGEKVGYYHVGWLKKSVAAGYTDDYLAEYISGPDTQRYFPDDADNYAGMDGLADGTDYYLVAVGYDSNGKRGAVTRHGFTTPVSSNKDPFVYYNALKYSSSYWQFTTSPNAYTSKFYMIQGDGDVATALNYLYTDAEVAAMLNEFIKGGDAGPYANNERTWKMERTTDATALLLVSWAEGVDNKLSPVINKGYYTINASSVKAEAPKKSTGTPRLIVRTAQEMQQLRDLVGKSIVR